MDRLDVYIHFVDDGPIAKILESLATLNRKVDMSTQALTDLQNAESVTQSQLAGLVTAIGNLQTAITNGIAQLVALIQAGGAGGIPASAVEAVVAQMKTDAAGVQTDIANLAAIGGQITAAEALAAGITVSVSPATVGPIPQGSTQQFTATTNDPAGVNWSLAVPALGSITNSGVYTPGTSSPGQDTVIATSVTDPTKSGTATVTF